jgi:hypothetical protein
MRGRSIAVSSQEVPSLRSSRRGSSAPVRGIVGSVVIKELTLGERVSEQGPGARHRLKLVESTLHAVGPAGR